MNFTQKEIQIIKKILFQLGHVVFLEYTNIHYSKIYI